MGITANPIPFPSISVDPAPPRCPPRASSNPLGDVDISNRLREVDIASPLRDVGISSPLRDVDTLPLCVGAGWPEPNLLHTYPARQSPPHRGFFFLFPPSFFPRITHLVGQLCSVWFLARSPPGRSAGACDFVIVVPWNVGRVGDDGSSACSIQQGLTSRTMPSFCPSFCILASPRSADIVPECYMCR